MACFEREEVMGFWIGGQLVCPECILPTEVDDLKIRNLLTSDEINEEDYYFCDRCEERIS
jgi:hypothetical protein